jgi:hypothetical protein
MLADKAPGDALQGKRTSTTLLEVLLTYLSVAGLAIQGLVDYQTGLLHSDTVVVW